MKRFSVLLMASGILTISMPTIAQLDSVGTIDFPTSATGEAQQHFLRGVAILHSFGWKQAIEQFRAAQELDPDFALAYWGEALSYNHPLLVEVDDQSPRETLQRLGATPAERLAKAPTHREKGLLGAVERLWGEGDWRERRIAYMEAMTELYEAYPDDDEIATFYALSLLSGARAMGDSSLRLEMQAGAIALGILDRNPNHPGAAHFVIHSFDDPLHAPIALPAAHVFAGIAPVVSHARHMPTHIFIQHGMWDLVSTHNQSAYEVAMELWQPGDSVSDAVHSLDWGHYGDLQLGDYEKARVWLDRLNQIARDSDGQRRALVTIPMLEARYIVETEQWSIGEIENDTPAYLLLSTGISSVYLGELDTAKQAEAMLQAFVENGNEADVLRDSDVWIPIMQREVAALIEASQGNADQAITLMDEALAFLATVRPPNGAANPVKPAYELYGEILLMLDRPEDAIAKFETSLQRMPNRPRSVLGLARALERTGDEEGAAERYRQLSEIWEGRESLTGLQEARDYIGVM